MFPQLFAASLAAYERLRKELKDYPVETSAIFSTEPLENLVELSGYAMIYSEIGPQNTWRVVKDMWDRYLAAAGDSAGTAKWLGIVMKLRGEKFAINPGDLQRTNWKQHFEHDMRNRGWLDDRWSGGPWEYRKRKVHTSPSVRALLRGGGLSLFSDLADVFLVVYLMKKTPPGDMPMTAKTADFAAALEREKSRDPKAPDDDDDDGVLG